MNIDLNIDELIEELNLPTNTADAIVENAVEAVTVEIFRNWSLEATAKLNSTRQGYINGLEVLDKGNFSRIIRLNGQFNNMLEKGCSAFDMKDGFRKSSKVKYTTKIGKGGVITHSWYLTIPFRHGVPTTIGDNSAFSGILPQEVYDAVKVKKSNEGLKRSEIPSPYDLPKTRRAIVVPNAKTIPAYQHKSSIYQGVSKRTGAYEKVTQNTYVSFRRVSENSDENSWMHKGLEAGNFLEKAINNTDVETIVENSIDKTLSNLGYGN